MLEIETKLYLGSEQAAREACRRLNLVWQDGVFERNRIFDFADGRLGQRGALVRLRERAPGGFLTYKEKTAERAEAAKVRLEYDTAVTDPGATLRLLEGLGLVETLIYERYRARHTLGSVHVELDFLPGGWFCEIEAPVEEIRRTRRAAGLEDQLPLVWSYPEIFAGIRAQSPQVGRDWTFDAFKHAKISLPPAGDAFWARASQAD